ncbi:hypothetical protein [Natronobacterium gregoryi]|nr:hypothetical protein [Natronobacterium gregoryi]
MNEGCRADDRLTDSDRSTDRCKPSVEHVGMRGESTREPFDENRAERLL